MRKQIYGITTLVILAMFAVFLAGCKSGGITGQAISEPAKCTKQEAYTAQIPYNDTDYVWVEECLDKNGPYCKEFAYTEFTLKVSYFGKKCDIKVTNTGDITGDWTIRAKFITTNAGGGPTSQPQTKTIKPGETALFEFFYTAADNPTSCTNVNDAVPTDKDCKCSFIGKKRVPTTVVKYRSETRYRTVETDC